MWWTLLALLAQLVAVALELGLNAVAYVVAPITARLHGPRRRLRERLRHAETYAAYRAVCAELDRAPAIGAWRRDPVSRYYDHRLIQHRLRSMVHARESGDLPAMMHLVRSGLLRNLGGIGDRRLYVHARTGTKQLIEDYHREVVRLIDAIVDGSSDRIDGAHQQPRWSRAHRNHSDHNDPNNNGHAGPRHQSRRSRPLSITARLEFLNETRLAYGGTALLLHGGASLGICHLGVVKALADASLLPRYVSGANVGALVAAMVGTHTDAELLACVRPRGVNLTAFRRRGTDGTVTRKIIRFLKHGYLLDVRVLEELLRANVGEMTFEEAFRRTGRVLNITVATFRTNEIPRLLNYLTAPNVLVWSAACASMAVTGLYDAVDLLAKDRKGNIRHWAPSAVLWRSSDAADADADADAGAGVAVDDRGSLERRLAELFGVNHFLVSDCATLRVSPLIQALTQSSAYDATADAIPLHVSDHEHDSEHDSEHDGGAVRGHDESDGDGRRRHAPLPSPPPPPSSSPPWGARALASARHAATLGLSLGLGELRHLLLQLGRLGLMPRGVARALAGVPHGQRHVVIAPTFGFVDYRTMFAHPTDASLQEWTRKGERSTWPHLSWIAARTTIEYALDDAIARLHAALRAEAAAHAEAADPRLMAKRNKSIT